MDGVMANLGCSECPVKPEVLVLYGVIAVLLTVVVNWVLATIIFMLRPFTCAAILFTFIRPDVVHNFVREDFIKFIAHRSKVFVGKVIDFVTDLADQYSRQR